jgi:pyruvate/2-oxoglutarate dehydrogenase complex dihydrolipoamide dehydrogenase (E3) component
MSRIVDSMSGGQQKMDSRGIDVIYGDAQFTSDQELQVDGERIQGERFIVATGARPAVPAIDGLNTTGHWTSFNAIYPDRQPESLLVIGGSAIGCEFAQIYARLGTRVTIIEMQQQLLYGEDGENALLLADQLRSEGVGVLLGTRAIEAVSSAEGKRITIENDDGRSSLYADELLLAVGRVPELERLGLDAAGVEVLEGAIAVDEQMNTSQPHIWACGDATGKPMLSHLASYEGNIAGRNASASGDVDAERVDYRAVPRAVFTDPPVASVGVTENEALEAGLDVIVGRAPYRDSGRAVAMGETVGQVKLLADKGSRELLGAHIFGAGADTLIHEAVVAMGSGLEIDALLRPRTIHTHPTLSELVGMAAAAAR